MGPSSTVEGDGWGIGVRKRVAAPRPKHLSPSATVRSFY